MGSLAVPDYAKTIKVRKPRKKVEKKKYQMSEEEIQELVDMLPF